MNLRLIFNIFFLIGLNLLIKPFWSLGIDVEVQNQVGHQVYGSYQALLSLSLIFSILLDLGIQTFNSRQVASSPKTFQSLFPNMMIAKLFLAVIYMGLISLVAYLLNYRGREIYLLGLIGFMQVAVSYLLFVRSNIAALQRFNLDSFLSVLDKLIAISLCGYFLYVKPDLITFSIFHFAAFQVIGYAVTLLIGWGLTYRLFTFKWSGFNFSRLRVIMKKGVPYAALVFFMGIYARTDIILLDIMFDKSSIQSGVYAASYRLLDLSNNMLGVLIAGILMPLFVKMLAEKERLNGVLKMVSTFMLGASLWIAFWVYFYDVNIVSILYDHNTEQTVQVLGVLIWVLPISSLSYIYSTLLTAGGHLRFLIIRAVFSGIVSVLLNLILIPYYGAIGAAIVSVITHALYVGSVILRVKKIHNFVFPFQFLIRIIVWSIITIFSFVILKKFYPEEWILVSLLVAVISLITIVLFGGVSWKVLKKMISKSK